MSAAELRRAAETLRSLATEALPAPWSVRTDSDSLHDVQSDSCGHALAEDGHDTEADCDEWGIAVAAADLHTGACMLGDARYIATMHPGVGLALADWLDETAESRARAEELLGTTRFSTSKDHLPTALARLINGGAA